MGTTDEELRLQNRLNLKQLYVSVLKIKALLESLENLESLPFFIIYKSGFKETTTNVSHLKLILRSRSSDFNFFKQTDIL